MDLIPTLKIEVGPPKPGNMVKIALLLYSNAQIEEVFFYLIDCPNLTALDISKETLVSVYTVRAIASLNEHKWLKSKYPEKYSILESLKGMSNKSDKFSAAARGI